MTTADLGTILSVWAHPDDETYLAGGVMAAAAERGQRVVCVSATAGEHGTPDPQTWPPERLGQLRRWEAAAAMAVLGVSEHRFLGLPDGALVDHEAEGRAAIGRLLDEIEPDTILTFGPDGVTFHPDHIAVSRWTTSAWERARPPRPPAVRRRHRRPPRPFRRAVRRVGCLHDRRAPGRGGGRRARGARRAARVAARPQAHRAGGDGLADRRRGAPPGSGDLCVIGGRGDVRGRIQDRGGSPNSGNRRSVSRNELMPVT